MTTPSRSPEVEIGADERVWSHDEIQQLCGVGRPAQSVARDRSAEKSATAFRYAAANLAHDLNNVFAPIVTSIEVLRLHFAGDEKARELLALIERHIRQGPLLSQQVLGLAQGLENIRAKIQPMRLVRSLTRRLKDVCPKNIEVQIKAEADLWPVVGALENLHEALFNLCLNACEAMPQGGLLSITVENIVLDDDFPFLPAGAVSVRHILFTLSDTGDGIADEIQERIFEDGFTTKPGDGRGRGLFLANKIVEAHQGHLTIYSEKHEGATFKLYLPAAPRAISELTVPDVQSLRGHGEGILVVDDEDAMRLVTQQTFESFGYRVLSAANGADAISAYLQEKRGIALVVTDMNMPIMDGAMTIHALRDINPMIKIIATSGRQAATQVSRAISAGANQFIPKPYTAVNLLRAVHETLSSAPIVHDHRT